jgi:hypothetical protein
MNLQYEPIFVEATKLPITSKDVACAVEEKVRCPQSTMLFTSHQPDQRPPQLSKRQEDGELQELSPAEMKSLRVETRESMIVSFLLNRLKVPDNANEPPSPKRSPKRSSGDESLGPQRPFLQRLSTGKEGAMDQLPRFDDCKHSSCRFSCLLPPQIKRAQSAAAEASPWRACTDLMPGHSETVWMISGRVGWSPGSAGYLH